MLYKFKVTYEDPTGKSFTRTYSIRPDTDTMTSATSQLGKFVEKALRPELGLKIVKLRCELLE